MIENYSKEKYIEDRKNNYVRYDLAWFMFSESKKNKPELSKEQFFTYFNYWIKSGFADLTSFWCHFDSFFEVTFIYDNKNNLISIK